MHSLIARVASGVKEPDLFPRCDAEFYLFPEGGVARVGQPVKAPAFSPERASVSVPSCFMYKRYDHWCGNRKGGVRHFTSGSQ